MSPPETRRESRALTPETLVQNDQLAANPPEPYHRPETAEDVACDPFAASVLWGEWLQLQLRDGAA